MIRDPPSARVFISYSRKDGAAFAQSLRTKLEQQDLSIWQDIVALEGGRDWWSQIEDAIRSKTLQHFVLVITPAALSSLVVRHEIRLARQQGKTVLPVKGPGVGELGNLPRWLGHVLDIDLPEHFTTLVRVLRGQSQQIRVRNLAPKPPEDFVQRPAEFNALRAELLDAKGDAVAISAALKGAGGYGKTTLAKALAHDPDIQDAYFDGVLWVELGEKPDDLLGVIADLVTMLTGTPPGLSSVNAAAAALGDALGERRILMIVDDVWREQDLRPFLHGGPNTTRLITTRLSGVLPADAFRQPVDAMKGDEARDLLSSGLPRAQVLARSATIGELAARLGECAQMLKLVNGFLRQRVIEAGEPLQDALADANARLTEEGLVAFDADDEDDRSKAVARTINLSLGLLDEKQRARFAELAVFPEDADIPIGIVARLWREIAGLSERQVKDLLVRFYGLSLLLGLDLDRRSFRFHDTILRFLQDQAGKGGLVAGHQRLLRALEVVGGSPETDGPSQRYFYLYLPHHMGEAGERAKLDRLLLDPRWLKAKLSATGNPHALVVDYEHYGTGELQDFVGRTLRLTTGILARDQRQLIPQLLGRIIGCKSIGATEFLEAVRRELSPPAILERRLSLSTPGAETARLEEHSHWVTTLCMLPDGRLASGSHDNTIRLWDVKSGAETACLEGHSNWIATLCVLPDGRLASGSADRTIRLWDLKTGDETARLEGLGVRALCALPDGRLASGSDDGTVRLWDLETGAETACLEGHSAPVKVLCALPDGRLASGSDDETISLWDVDTGAETARLEGSSESVTALCALPDGRLASGSWDNILRLWDTKSGVEARRLEGHSGMVTALCALPDGRLASGSDDDTIRLWDVRTGVEARRLNGHSNSVTALCALPDGRLASGSNDNTIRLWDLTNGPETAELEGQSPHLVTVVCALPDGRLASGSDDKSIRLWDVATGAETARLEGKLNWARSLCALPNGWLASGSADGAIRLWDIRTGAETACLEGHSGSVNALCVTPSGQLASGSDDETVRLWDVVTGAETARLEGHSSWIWALCALPDGRLASGSHDGIIRLWDIEGGAEAIRLEGHSNRVASLCALPDGRLASGSNDNTVRLWDIKTGAETACLEGHSDIVSALCALSNGQLASGSRDNTIRLWNVKTGAETVRLEADAPIRYLIALPNLQFAASDGLGRLHWLEVVGLDPRPAG